MRQPDFSPLPARPGWTIFEALLKRGERKIQQHHKGQLILKEIIGDVSRWIIAADHFIQRKHRAKIKVELLAKLAIDFVHVSAQLLQHAFQPVEDGIKHGLISGEIGAHETFKSGGITIVGALEPSDLIEASLNSPALGLPIAGGQLMVQFRG
ncbi:MAG TPA: hypothetical protein VK579_06570 [Terriglobales bacterium]|nr:hypothetical protein [Terriglobales bacterium]